MLRLTMDKQKGGQHGQCTHEGKVRRDAEGGAAAADRTARTYRAVRPVQARAALGERAQSGDIPDRLRQDRSDDLAVGRRREHRAPKGGTNVLQGA